MGGSTAGPATPIESCQLPGAAHQRPDPWDAPRGHLPKSDNISERAMAGSAQACIRHLNWADQVHNA